MSEKAGTSKPAMGYCYARHKEYLLDPPNGPPQSEDPFKVRLSSTYG